jgi:hypothetical protein
MELESLLGGLVADLTRRCDIMFPEGDTTTLGFDCEETWRDPSFELAESVGDDAFASVGVGGVTSVVGASTRFGGVAGIWVMIRLGANDRNDVVDFVPVSSAPWPCAQVQMPPSAFRRATVMFPAYSEGSRSCVEGTLLRRSLSNQRACLAWESGWSRSSQRLSGEKTVS